MKSETIRLHIRELESSINALSDTGQHQFSESDCPLGHDHYNLSQILFGMGRHRCECKYCGESEDS